jgi:hypothetical protein
MKLFRLAVRAAVLLTTGPPLLAMAACTASTVTTLQALSGPAADVQTVSAATAQQYAADYYLPPPDGRNDPDRRWPDPLTADPLTAAPGTEASGGRDLGIKASGQFAAPWHAVGRDHDVIVSAYQGFKP